MLYLSIGSIIVSIVAPIALVGAVICGWYISTMNKLKKYQVKIGEADSGIDVALTRRYDYLTKAFDVAKAYAKHEKETLYEVIKMRQGMTMSEKTDADMKMSQMALAIKALSESYPTLKANDIFVTLQKEIKETEEQLQASRRIYNANVSEYNQMLVTFPISLAFKYAAYQFFKAEEHKRQDVKF